MYSSTVVAWFCHVFISSRFMQSLPIHKQNLLKHASKKRLILLGYGPYVFHSQFLFFSYKSLHAAVYLFECNLVFTKALFLIIFFSGESMENALRACCKGIKIGKILIHRDGDKGQQVCPIS